MTSVTRHTVRDGRMAEAEDGGWIHWTDYQRAVEFLRDIADLAGTTKRKQAGCEIAAHALAQLGEPRERDDSRP